MPLEGTENLVQLFSRGKNLHFVLDFNILVSLLQTSTISTRLILDSEGVNESLLLFILRGGVVILLDNADIFCSPLNISFTNFCNLSVELHWSTGLLFLP